MSRLPPDRRGLIHENDAASLRKFKQIIEQTFAENLAEQASVKIIKQNEFPLEMVVKLGKPQTFDRIILQEDIREGQPEKFR